MRTMGTLNAPPRSPKILPMNSLSLVSSTIVVPSVLFARVSSSNVGVGQTQCSSTAEMFAVNDTAAITGHQFFLRGTRLETLWGSCE